MLRRVWLTIILLCVAGVSPALAQSDSARIATLESKVAVLEQILGTKFLASPPAQADLVPANELPNGKYPYMLSDFQLRVGLAEGFGGLQNQVSGLAARLAAVESRSGLGRTIRADTLILGNCKYTDQSSMLAICGQFGADIHFESNLNSQQYQNPAPHVGMIALSGDGGIRTIQNGYGTVNCFDDVDPTNGVHYQNCLKRFVDPTREYSQIGTDSRGSWSVIRAFNGIDREYTQDVVLMIDPATKTVAWESWQSGWRWYIRSSTCRVCRDIQIPLQ